jgi:FtsZ-binding cell division protein ZapB
MSKMFKCKACGELYAKQRPLQKVCSPVCAIKLAKVQVEKAQAKEKAQDRKQTKAKLDAMKGKAKWIKECQQLVNKYVRLRDIRKGLGCVSCGAQYREGYGGAFDAGHLRSVGSAPQLRFLTTQISLQCVKCNRYGGGRVFEFRAEMIKRNGQAWMERLQSLNGRADYTIDYLKKLKSIVQKKIKRIEEKS